MFINPLSLFMWNARTIDNKPVKGILKAVSKFSAKKSLQKSGYYRVVLQQVPESTSTTPLKLEQLLAFINSLILMLASGMSIRESLELLQVEKRSVTLQFIYFRLLEELEKGLTLKQAFVSLSLVFPSFFIAMVELAEQSNQLLKGLQSAHWFYQEKLKSHQEIKNISRYPKVVLFISISLFLVVVIVIIPMFQNIYALFGEDLPFMTRILVSMSRVIHEQYIAILLIFLIIVLFFKVSFLKQLNPLLIVRSKIKQKIESTEDPYIYALSMKLQLENGHSVISAARNASKSISKSNDIHGTEISEFLEAGFGLTEAFSKSKWFPKAFAQLLSTAEKAGKLHLGFGQVASYLEQKRRERFSFWSKFLEPALMISLGTLVLTILLAVYLPIFDIGNRVG